MKRFPSAIWQVTVAVVAIAAFSLRMYAAADSRPLRVYFVDVEGGQATLFVTPEGHSLLVDTGWPGNQSRDADRIVAAARDAGINKIEYVLITHSTTTTSGEPRSLRRKSPSAPSSITGKTAKPPTELPKNAGWPTKRCSRPANSSASPAAPLTCFRCLAST